VLIEYVWTTVLASILYRPFSTRSFHPLFPVLTPDVSTTVTVPSHDAWTLRELVSLIMYLNNSGNTLSTCRTTTPRNTRPVSAGITDKPPLRIRPSLIALPHRKTPHDVLAAAPTRASALIDESTRKPPRDRAVTASERNQTKTPSIIPCLNAQLPRIDYESP